MPLGLARPHERPFALGPPRPEVNFLIDAATGDCHALDPPDFPHGLPYPQPRDEPIRFRAEVMEPGESFDQTGFELPPPPQVAPADAGQGELFGDDYSQPDSADGEPVFWSASGEQASLDDDCVQADAAESICFEDSRLDREPSGTLAARMVRLAIKPRPAPVAASSPVDFFRGSPRRSANAPQPVAEGLFSVWGAKGAALVLLRPLP